MKILLTGSGGNLSNYIELVNENNFEIISLNKDQLDITNFKQIEFFIKKFSPEIIINSAAYTDVDGCEINKKLAEQINSFGPKNIAILCKKNKIKLIHISTDYVYDGLSKKPYKENNFTNPISEYGKTKLKGEQFIKDEMDEYFIFRTSWLFGNSGSNFVSNILEKSKNKKNFQIINDQFGTPTYYKDLAIIILNSIELINDKNLYGIYNFSSNGNFLSWYDFAIEIFKTAKKYGYNNNTIIKPINTSEFKKIFNSLTNRPHYSVLNSSNCKKIFNFSGNDWKKSLEIIIKEIIDRE
jgi:dTDP-4-dehydrorhamnose reductase